MPPRVAFAGRRHPVPPCEHPAGAAGFLSGRRRRRCPQLTSA